MKNIMRIQSVNNRIIKRMLNLPMNIDNKVIDELLGKFQLNELIKFNTIMINLR